MEEGKWEPYGKPDGEVTRECADVLFVPNEHIEQKELQPLRYVAVRIRRRQGGLLEEAAEDRHFAVLTNIRDWKAGRLLGWHREKAGTIKAVHDVLKNELSAGVLPCGRFGANAAWLRLAILTHNVLTALKRLALPAALLQARPKRLRFSVLQYGASVGASCEAHNPAPGQQCKKVDRVSGSTSPAPAQGLKFPIDGFAELFWHNFSETAFERTQASSFLPRTIIASPLIVRSTPLPRH